jgi:membrane protease YdiL (CAAX protease family)
LKSAALRVPLRLALGSLVVVASMVVLFTVPPVYFAAATFISTGCMVAAAYALGALSPSGRPRLRQIVIGAVSAVGLYLVFYLGGYAINVFHPFGITSASESSIYSLISSPSNPLYLQVGLLLFDSAGYESFFRGVLQKKLTPRLGVGAAPAVALLDAGLHVVTLNPVWVGATFVTDLVWGLTFHYGKGAKASFTSHLLWDLAIFIIRPIR